MVAQVFPSLGRPQPESHFLTPGWAKAQAMAEIRKRAFAVVYILIETNTSCKHLYTELFDRLSRSSAQQGIHSVFLPFI